QRTTEDIKEQAAAWTGSARQELEAERDKWQQVAAQSGLSAAQRREAETALADVTKKLSQETTKYQEGQLENQIEAAKRGSAGRIAGAQRYFDFVKGRFGAESTEAVEAERKLIEARNEGANAGSKTASRDATQDFSADVQKAQDEAKRLIDVANNALKEHGL